MDLIQFFGRFHVLVLHLPIGILLMASVIEAYCAIRSMTRSTTLNTIWLWGVISAIAACVLGYMLSLGGGYSPEAVEIHRTWGISAAFFSLICWVVFQNNLLPFKPIILSLCTAQLLILFSTGHYGANMTHGPTYLFEYAPNSVRIIAGMTPHEKPRQKVIDIEQADIYLDIIRPALKQRCVGCHNPGKSKGKLDLSQYASLLKGGKSGPAIVSGDIENSELFQRITLDNHDKKYMPADGKIPLNEDQIAALKWWITNKAPDGGLVANLTLKTDEKKILARAIGLETSAGAWPLKPIKKMPLQLRIDLENHGFLVKQISTTVNYIDLDFSSSNKPLTESAISALVSAKDYVAWLNIGNSKVSDQHLLSIAKLNNLIKLRLEKNPISSAGLKPLTTLKYLQYLNLYGTKINDNAFQYLENITTLKSIYLMMTDVSPSAVTTYINNTTGMVNVVTNHNHAHNTIIDTKIVKQ